MIADVWSLYQRTPLTSLSLPFVCPVPDYARVVTQTEVISTWHLLVSFKYRSRCSATDTSILSQNLPLNRYQKTMLCCKTQLGTVPFCWTPIRIRRRTAQSRNYSCVFVAAPFEHSKFSSAKCGKHWLHSELDID